MLKSVALDHARTPLYQNGHRAKWRTENCCDGPSILGAVSARCWFWNHIIL